MRDWSAARVAQAAGAHLICAPASAAGPERVIVDSRRVDPGALFVGLPGARVDGGAFAREALAGGAWGALVAPKHAAAAGRAIPVAAPSGGAGRALAGVLLVAEDPLGALQRLATAWRRELGAQVIGVTGSTGKTSTKDLLAAVLSPHRRTVASRANFNTEVGLPLEILSAPAGTEVLVLEMGMRGAGQIAELAAIAEPDVGVIVTVGPVHLELLGSVEAVAAAKGELIAALPAGATAIIPAAEPLLEPHLRSDLVNVRFGDGGDVRLLGAVDDRVEIDLGGRRLTLEVPFRQAHLRSSLLAAVAAAQAVGVLAAGRIALELSPGRGQRVSLPGAITVIDDCYNANPVSMRAALEDLAVTAAGEERSRKIAVLGDMLELGREARSYHLEIGERAGAAGVDVLVTVGVLAAAMSERFGGEAHPVADAREAAALLPELLEPGDTVLVKASRGVGLELVCEALVAGAGR